MKIPYGRQLINAADVEAVAAVLRSDFLTQGSAVPAFEGALAAYCGAGQAVAVSNATAALHLACMALGVGPGDMVWTSPNTFVASANCARYCGADVDFVDIDARTYNMSLARLAEKLAMAEHAGRLPKVVIPVHFSGQPCDMAGIHALGQRYGFKIIEDASHAVGGRYLGETIGNGRYSNITVFSFHPVKIVTTAEGGAALTNDAHLADEMRRLRSHGITNDPRMMRPRAAAELWNYQQIALGYNYRMTDLQAALGSSQMTRLDEFVERRRGLATRYDRQLVSVPVTLPWQHPDGASSYHLYVIRVPEAGGGPTQRQVYDALHAADILANLHYIPVYRQPYYEQLGFREGLCGEAERYHREAISLPMFPGLTEAQQDHVVGTLRAVTSA